MNYIVSAIASIFIINIGCHLAFSDDKCDLIDIVVAIAISDYKFLNSHCDLKKARFLRNVLWVLIIVYCIMKL